MPVWYREEGHSTLLLLDKKNIFAHYLTFSWAVLNLSLNCAGHTKSSLYVLLSFHYEGGWLPPTQPPKSATVPRGTPN